MERPTATTLIIALCGLFFLAKLVLEAVPAASIGGLDPVTALFSLTYARDAGVLYRMLTYAFVHSGFLHLLFNMIVLFFTAKPLEERIGARRLALLFCFAAYFCGLFTLLHMTLVPWASKGLVLGASGAVCAFLFIFWRMNPDATLLLFFVIPVPIRYMMIGLIALDLTGTLVPLRTGVAHATHLAGYLFGYLYLKYGDRAENALERLRARREWRLTVSHTRQRQEKRNYYQEQVDPILKKISEKGMESLTDIEKHILKKAKEYGGRE